MANSIPIDRISPWHGPYEHNKVASIRSSMETNGWIGRPLLVYQRPRDWKAITGSHRYAAAKAAGIKKIPCVALERATLPDGQDLWEVLENAGNSGPVFLAIYESGLDDEILGLAALDTFQSNPPELYPPEMYSDHRALGRWIRARLDANEDGWALPPPWTLDPSHDH